jgi:hypothetical protein
MNYQELRKRLPEDFDPETIWYDYQEQSKATSESYYVYAEDGSISVVWILDSLEQFRVLMSCLLFKDIVPDGLDYYDTEDEDILEQFESRISKYNKLNSGTLDVAKCNDFIRNDFENDNGRHGFCVYELGKVSDLLSIDKEQFEFLRNSESLCIEDNFPTNIEGVTIGKIWICVNYHSDFSPSESKEDFLDYLSESVVINM